MQQEKENTQQKNLWDQIHGNLELTQEPTPEIMLAPEQEIVLAAEETTAEPPAPKPKKKKTTKRWWIPTIVAVLVLSVGLTLFFTCRKRPTSEPEELVSVWLLAESESSAVNGTVATRRVYTYDASGNLTDSVSYVDGRELSHTVNTYDEDGNLLEQVSYVNEIESSRESYTWDFRGNMTGYTQLWDGTNALQYTYTYGWNGKISDFRVVDSRLIVTDFKLVYDSRGNVICQTGRSGGKEHYRKEYTFDEAGRLTGKVEYRGEEKYAVELYAYNLDGTLAMQQTQFENSKGFYTYFYDSNGNCIKEYYYQDGKQVGSTVYTYDAAGQLTQMIRFDGDTKSFQYYYIYDEQGRRIEEHFTEGDYQHTIQKTYDEAGNLTQLRTTINGKTSVTLQTFDEHGNCTGFEIWSEDTLKTKSTQTFVEVKVSAQRAEELKKTQGRPEISAEYTNGSFDEDGFIPS